MGQKRKKPSRVKKLNTDESGSDSDYPKAEVVSYVSSEEESNKDESAGERDASDTRTMRELVLQQNRRKKKSGGFQSMGTYNSLTLACVTVN